VSDELVLDGDELQSSHFNNTAGTLAASAADNYVPPAADAHGGGAVTYQETEALVAQSLLSMANEQFISRAASVRPPAVGMMSMKYTKEGECEGVVCEEDDLLMFQRPTVGDVMSLKYEGTGGAVGVVCDVTQDKLSLAFVNSEGDVDHVERGVPFNDKDLKYLTDNGNIKKGTVPEGWKEWKLPESDDTDGEEEMVASDTEAEDSDSSTLPQGVTAHGTSYQVRVGYQGSMRHIGTFQTLEQATTANEIARSMLKKDKGLQLSAEECQQNIKLAKEAALTTAMPDRKEKLPKGVRATTVGKYQVAVWYQGRNSAIGTFQNLEQATLASEVVHNMLEKDKGLQLSTEECERNFKQAKEAALKGSGKKVMRKKVRHNKEGGTPKGGRKKKQGGTATPQDNDIIVGNNNANKARAISESLSQVITSKVKAYANAEGDDAKKMVAQVRRLQY